LLGIALVANSQNHCVCDLTMAMLGGLHTILSQGRCGMKIRPAW